MLSMPGLVPSRLSHRVPWCFGNYAKPVPSR
ncbi:hypothetical protein PMIN01_01682 [Paraphaeosphaeria minitans]|uniref:Uncharacterized protein n=1 Tax=Paraphaeosphaeria minitans TaxID=565426 RepID=A0A9P6GPX5_9PLEO|nr:hypothetical protein PMIN01_01682 [Paraphaeosphaeria minitans]